MSDTPELYLRLQVVACDADGNPRPGFPTLEINGSSGPPSPIFGKSLYVAIYYGPTGAAPANTDSWQYLGTQALGNIFTPNS